MARLDGTLLIANGSGRSDCAVYIPEFEVTSTRCILGEAQIGNRLGVKNTTVLLVGISLAAGRGLAALTAVILGRGIASGGGLAGRNLTKVTAGVGRSSWRCGTVDLPDLVIAAVGGGNKSEISDRLLDENTTRGLRLGGEVAVGLAA